MVYFKIFYQSPYNSHGIRSLTIPAIAYFINRLDDQSCGRGRGEPTAIAGMVVPGLKNMPVLVTLKIRYTNRKAPAQRPFLLAGELASPAGRVLVVLG